MSFQKPTVTFITRDSPLEKDRSTHSHFQCVQVENQLLSFLDYEMKNIGKVTASNNGVEDPLNGVNLQLLSQLLPRQSPRWCQLTMTLYSLVVLDTQRNPDILSLQQFLEVIHWRANGKITEDEFSVLFTEWMKLDKNSDSRSSINSNPNSKRKFFLNLSIFRVLLMEKSYFEADLDLFIGILIHETNLRLTNTTISYMSKAVTGKPIPAFNLEVVTRKWLELAEELFFSLDTPGYGSLRFDEIFFLSNCINIGLQGWKNEQELESDLSITTMTAIALQFMRDCGANLPINSSSSLNTTSKHGAYDYYDELPKSSLKKTPATSIPFLLNQKEAFKTEVTLPMLKKYLISKNIGENELVLLNNHLKLCIEKIAKLARLSGADDLYFACQPYEHKGMVIGSPRLFQEAVLFASGFQPPTTNLHAPGNNNNNSSSNNNAGLQGPGNTNQQIPLILLFLLSDGEKYLSGLFRAIEFDVEGLGFGGEEKRSFSLNNSNNNVNGNNGSNENIDYTNPLNSIISANEELHENAKRLFTLFRFWSQNELTNLSNLNKRDVFYPMNSNELLRDPTYQLIISTLLHFKRLQQILNAALYDFAINQFGSAPVQHTNFTANQLSIVCANLLPSPQSIFIEFGLSHPENGNNSNNSNNLAGDNSADQDELESQLSGNPNSLTSNPLLMAAMILNGTDPKDIMQLDELEGNNNPGSNKAPGAGAGKRGSQFAGPAVTLKVDPNSNFTTPAQGNQNSSANRLSKAPSVSSAEGNSSRRNNNPPNFLRPTQTFMAKTSARHRIESTDSMEGAGVDLPNNSGDSEINKAKWQSLLDVRATPPNAAAQAPPLVSARIVTSSSNGTNEDRPASSLSQSQQARGGVSPSNLVLGEDESKLLAQLLTTTNPHEQSEILAKLRNRIPASSVASASSQSRGPVLPTPIPPPPPAYQELLDSSNEMNPLSPLSLSPKSPPNNQKSASSRNQLDQSQKNKAPKETFTFNPSNSRSALPEKVEAHLSDVSSSNAPSSVRFHFVPPLFFSCLLLSSDSRTPPTRSKSWEICCDAPRYSAENVQRRFHGAIEVPRASLEVRARYRGA